MGYETINGLLDCAALWGNYRILSPQTLHPALYNPMGFAKKFQGHSWYFCRVHNMTLLVFSRAVNLSIIRSAHYRYFAYAHRYAHTYIIDLRTNVSMEM